MGGLLSICVPAYHMNGAGSKCLKQLLQSTLAQNYTNFEVIISDHSDCDSLLKVVDQFNDSRLKHYYYRENKGSSSANVNNAINLASSDKIKIMFQDDFFVSRDAVEITHGHLRNNKWGVCSCIHYVSDEKNFYRPHYPYWQDDIKRGANTLGAPSVVFFNRSDIRFDKSLLWFMDVDFYYSLYKMYGKPYIESKILVGIREDSTRVSNTMITNELIEKENKIMLEKYNQ